MRGFFGNICVRVRGIEPPTAAWKAAILPVNYTRKDDCTSGALRCSIANLGHNINHVGP